MNANRGQHRPPPSKRGNSSSGVRRRPRGFLRSDALRLGRSGLLTWALLAAGVAGGVMAIVAELSTISYVTVVTATCEDLADPRLADRCRLEGSERHSWAFALLGAFAILMAWGATVGRSRPAAAALGVVGLVLLGLGFARDLPEADRTGLIGEAYEATAHKGAGLWLELAAGVVMVAVALATLLLLLRRPDSRDAPRGSSSGEPAAAETAGTQ
jgi:drug/metabolite transporter (DMT)-like permease